MIDMKNKQTLEDLLSTEELMPCKACSHHMVNSSFGFGFEAENNLCTVSLNTTANNSFSMFKTKIFKQ